MKILLSFLLALLLVLISNVNTEEQKKYGEAQEIQSNKINGSNYVYNRGYGSDKYYGGKRPDGVVLNNNDSERIHDGSEDKETQQIQVNRTDGTNYIYNRRYGNRRHNGGEIYSTDNERRYGGSEEEEAEEIQANRTDGSDYINHRRYSGIEYDGGRGHNGSAIYSNDSERRYGVSEEEKTVEIQANRTDGSNYKYNRRYSGVEYDGVRRYDGGGIYSNDSERRYGSSEEEETVKIQANRTDGSNYIYNRRNGSDEYEGSRKHNGSGIYRSRNDSRRRHGGNVRERAREIVDKIKDLGQYMYNRKYGGDESDGGRRHYSGRRSYGDSQRYRGSERRGYSERRSYSQQRGNSQRQSFHSRHGDGGSKTNKLNTFIEYLIPVAQFIAVMAPML